MKYSIIFLWFGWSEIKRSFKNWVFVLFFYSRIHSRIFSSLNHKIRELMPPKRENSPNLYYYIYIVTPFCLASLNMLKDIYSAKGNMVTRLYSGINIITVNPIPVRKITHLLSNVRCSALFKVLTLTFIYNKSLAC